MANQEEETMTKKAIIIGAGPGGLASAMLLAKAGLEVDVFERQPHVGGRTTLIEADGFRFDTGPTFFMYPRVLEEIFRAVGKDMWKEIPMRRLDPQYKLVFGAGGELLATPDVDTMEQRVTALSPDDAGSFTEFLERNRRKMDVFRPVLEREFQGWGDLLSSDFLRTVPILHPFRSLDDELGKTFTDARLKLAFSFQSKYLGMAPASCPSVFSILSFIEYEYGVYHPYGGFGGMTRKMAEIAEELGARIHLSEPVEKLHFEGKKVVGVETPQGSYHADSVVLNGDFSRAAQRLIPDELRPSWSDERIDEADYSCSTFMLYLGIEGRYDDLPHHTIYVPESYEENLRDIEHRHVLTDDTSLYVQNASVTDPTLAPEGHSTLYVLVPVSHQHANIDWSQEKQRYRDLVIQQMEKLGITDLEQRIRYEKVVTPDDWSTEFEVHKGAVFNLAHNLGQMLHRRPRNRFDDLDGMYLVGGGTHPGSGLPVIFEGARISTRLLLEDLGLADQMPDHEVSESDDLVELDQARRASRAA